MQFFKPTKKINKLKFIYKIIYLLFPGSDFTINDNIKTCT